MSKNNFYNYFKNGIIKKGLKEIKPILYKWSLKI